MPIQVLRDGFEIPFPSCADDLPWFVLYRRWYVHNAGRVTAFTDPSTDNLTLAVALATSQNALPGEAEIWITTETTAPRVLATMKRRLGAPGGEWSNEKQAPIVRSTQDESLSVPPLQRVWREF